MAQNNTKKPMSTVPRTVSSRKIKLSHEEYVNKIKKRAYELYVERGQGHGAADNDWLNAESEINARYKI